MAIIWWSNKEFGVRNSVFASPEVFHEPVLAGKVEEVQEELETVGYFCCLHSEDPSEVHHGFFDGEFSV